MSVVTYHHRSNSRTTETMKRIHPISSDRVLGLFRPRLSKPKLYRHNLTTGCRPWLGFALMNILMSFRYPEAQLLRDQYVTKAKRDDFSPAYPFPGRRTRRRPGQWLESFLSADPKPRVQVLRWLCLQHQPKFRIPHTSLWANLFRVPRNGKPSHAVGLNDW